MKGVVWATNREREVNKRRKVCEIKSGRGEFLHVNLRVPSMLRLIHKVVTMVTMVRIEVEGIEKQSAR
jgi:hypothetical protein